MSSLLPPLERRVAAPAPRAVPAGTPLVGGHHVTLVDGAAAAHAALQQAIDGATDHVNLACRVDGAAAEDRLARLAGHLVARCAAGVRVNLLVDGATPGARWRAALARPGASLRDAAFATRWWHGPRGPAGDGMPALLLVADGGLGVVGAGPLAPGAAALLACVEGPAVQALQRRFVAAWQRLANAPLAPARYFRALGPAGTQRVAVAAAADALPAGPTPLIAALQAARRRVLLASDAAAPPRGVAAALRAAARRGVGVELHVPAGARRWAALAADGARVFAHAEAPPRAGVVDGHWCALGTDAEPALVVLDEGLAALLEARLRSGNAEPAAAGRPAFAAWQAALRTAWRR